MCSPSGGQFTSGRHSSGTAARASRCPCAPAGAQAVVEDSAHAAEQPSEPYPGDMNRRETLRLMSAAAAWITAGQVDPAPLADAADSPHDSRPDEHLAALNAALWARFATTAVKADLFPAVREHLNRLTAALRRPQSPAVRLRLCALAADMFQLIGELLFDANRYADAAHCYTLAAAASREAAAMDLWACALTRHAYISVYEQRFDEALPLLDLAGSIARHGDATLSTRHWVSAVRAQALAGTGDIAHCEQALDTAEQVRELGPHAHNGGWLRFDGSRLAEDRGACYVQQQRPDLAEPLLMDVLRSNPSGRRRGVALVDLAIVGALKRDPVQIVTHASAALDNVHQNSSGVVIRKLHGLRPHLERYRGDRHVRHVDAEIAQLRTRWTWQ